MDPDANIANQRQLIARLQADPSDQDARDDLAELNQALLSWLARGGFPPSAPDWAHLIDHAFRLLASPAGRTAP